MDMSRAYRSAVEECLPHVTIVFDRFHVMQLVNRAVDMVRRKQQKQLDEDGLRTLKGERFLFLANYDSLDRNKRERLDAAMAANEPLHIVHTMKEQLRLLWTKPDWTSARQFLGNWILDAIDAAYCYKEKTGSNALMPLRKLALSLNYHSHGILNYFKYRITNGKMEGVNNKIKTLKRQSYGFKDKGYFRLRLLHLHQQKVQLSG